VKKIAELHCKVCQIVPKKRKCPKHPLESAEKLIKSSKSSTKKTTKKKPWKCPNCKIWYDSDNDYKFRAGKLKENTMGGM